MWIQEEHEAGCRHINKKFTALGTDRDSLRQCGVQYLALLKFWNHVCLGITPVCAARGPCPCVVGSQQEFLAMFSVRRHQILFSRKFQIVRRTLTGFNLWQVTACIAVMLSPVSGCLMSLLAYQFTSQPPGMTKQIPHPPSAMVRASEEVKGNC